MVRAGSKALLGSLELPPEADQLLALEAQANAVSLWWTESTGPEVLPAYLALLRQLMDKSH